MDLRGFWLPGAIFFVEAGLMLLYSLHGKFRHRDRMLALANLRGDESVLDVGTGRGLLLVGAAKRLVTGRAVGLDIWKTSDLSGNARERTEKVLEQEGVTDRCKLLERRRRIRGCPMEVSMLSCPTCACTTSQQRGTGCSLPGDCSRPETWRRGCHL